MASISEMVKLSCTSAKLTSFGVSLACLKAAVRRDPGRGESDDAVAVCSASVSGLTGAEDLDRRLGVLLGLLHGAQHDRRRAVRVGGAVEHAQRVRPPWATLEHRVQVDLLLVLGLGVQRTVLVVLDRDRAICSRVVPYSCMCRRAIIACSEGTCAPNVTSHCSSAADDWISLDYVVPDVGHLLRARRPPRCRACRTPPPCSPSATPGRRTRRPPPRGSPGCCPGPGRE